MLYQVDNVIGNNQVFRELAGRLRKFERQTDTAASRVCDTLKFSSMPLHNGLPGISDVCSHSQY